MSLVGPRPEQLDLVARYAPEHRFRLRVKPGITGPMQVYGRGELRFDERLAVEREYVENLSLRKGRTAPAPHGRYRASGTRGVLKIAVDLLRCPATGAATPSCGRRVADGGRLVLVSRHRRDPLADQRREQPVP